MTTNRVHRKFRMKNKRVKLVTAFLLIGVLSWIPAGGREKMSHGKVLYRVSLVNDKAKIVAVKQNGKNMELSLEGFEKPVALKVNGGGVESCRTTLEHKSDQAAVTLSLPIPTPNMPCQMTAGYVSINSRTYNISISEAEVKKMIGRDNQLRKTVEKYFGRI